MEVMMMMDSEDILAVTGISHLFLFVDGAGERQRTGGRSVRI